MADVYKYVNKGAPGIPYFTPAQEPASGTPLSDNPPKLFQPLKIRGLEIQNRIGLSPMCQYSAEDGHHTAWHFTHYGGIIQRGPGLTVVEATAVLPNGRITPEDSGIYLDSHIEPLKKMVDFAHSQNQKIGIQLAHAGRKASEVAPWLSSGATAPPELHGWPDNVWGPSDEAWDEHHATPKAMTLENIHDLKVAWAAAVRRALQAGFDFIEIHCAHGYLLSNFISPAVNKRTDQYGGSFENRVRLPLEIATLTRNMIPDDMPLLFRVNGTDWLEEQDFDSWKGPDAVKLAPLLAERGVDLVDISGGGNHKLQHPHVGPAYHAPIAHDVKKAVGDKMLVSSVGMFASGKVANDELEKGLDFVFVGRAFQKNPGLVWAWAEEIGVEVSVANQIRWGFGGRGKKGTIKK